MAVGGGLAGVAVRTDAGLLTCVLHARALRHAHDAQGHGVGGDAAVLGSPGWSGPHVSHVARRGCLLGAAARVACHDAHALRYVHEPRERDVANRPLLVPGPQQPPELPQALPRPLWRTSGEARTVAQPSLARLAADAWGCGERRAGYADAAPVQSSGYAHDNWKFNCTDPQAYPAGTSKDIGDHPCFDPQKDIVVPQFKSEPAYGLPEGCLSPERPRKNLAFFAGRIREHPHRPLTPPVESLREVSAVQLLLTAKESQGDTTL